MSQSLLNLQNLHYNLRVRQAHKKYLSKKLNLIFRMLARLTNLSTSFLVLNLNSSELKLYKIQNQNKDKYIQNQVQGNVRKLKKIQAERDLLDIDYFSNPGNGNLAFLLKLLKSLPGDYHSPKLGICHGVRTGKENNFLMKYLPKNSLVLGTDISKTVEQFPNCLQWDFQQLNPDWQSKFDFVYSNSLDHAIRPFETLRIWIESLNPQGSLFLDLGPNSGKLGFTQLDVFAIEPEFFPFVFLRELSNFGAIKEIHFPDKNNKRKVIFEISRH